MPVVTAMLFILLLLIAPSTSLAMGIGYFYASGSGDSITRIEGSPDSRDPLDISGNGLFLDSNLGKDKTFNYRLEFGSGEYGVKDQTFDGLVMIHDFGFSPYRSKWFRLWAGPEVMLNSIDDTASAESPKLFGFGMGPAIGINLNISRRLSFTLKAAYIYQTLTGHMKVGGITQDLTTEDEFAYASVALVLRLGERF